MDLDDHYVKPKLGFQLPNVRPLSLDKEVIHVLYAEDTALPLLL